MIYGFELSEHARHQMQERNIRASWLEETLSDPEQFQLMADCHGNTHYLKRIQDFGSRWLRIIVNPNVIPNRIVTVFFDRRMK